MAVESNVEAVTVLMIVFSSMHIWECCTKRTVSACLPVRSTAARTANPEQSAPAPQRWASHLLSENATDTVGEMRVQTIFLYELFALNPIQSRLTSNQQLDIML